MSACFCTGICQRTGMCGGQQITGNWPPHQWVPEPYVKLPQSQPQPIAGSWQCAGCGRIYNMTVNSCDCQVRRSALCSWATSF
jgi:hypothetical protein